MATKDKGMYFQADFWDAVSVLPDKDADALTAAIVRYWFTGDEPKLKASLLAVFLGMKSRIDLSKTRQQSASKARAKREQNASKTRAKVESSIKSEREKENKETSPIGEVKKAAKKFEPPSVEEVAAYAAEKGLEVDANRFCDYYAAQGWRLSNGVAMKDWTAAARNWSARNRKGGSGAVDLGAYSGAW